MRLSGRVEQNTFCCGLNDLGEITAFDKTDTWSEAIDFRSLKSEGLAVMVTTAAHQKSEVKLLKKAKFKKLGAWTNPNTKNRVTMWGWFPRKKVK